MTDQSYTHDPAAFDESGDRVENGDPASSDAAHETTTGGETTAGTADGAGLTDRQQWLVVGVVLLCFVGFPAAIFLYPPEFLGFRDAYWSFSMIPGLILGATGVWLLSRR